MSRKARKTRKPMVLTNPNMSRFSQMIADAESPSSDKNKHHVYEMWCKFMREGKTSSNMHLMAIEYFDSKGNFATVKQVYNGAVRLAEVSPKITSKTLEFASKNNDFDFARTIYKQADGNRTFFAYLNMLIVAVKTGHAKAADAVYRDGCQYITSLPKSFYVKPGVAHTRADDLRRLKREKDRVVPAPKESKAKSVVVKAAQAPESGVGAPDYNPVFMGSMPSSSFFAVSPADFLLRGVRPAVEVQAESGLELRK
ncbi:MAG: hypothetical protein P1U40_14065 [Coxiellaceae bacterium]|nr:hypothetical protein [Coxiellaceae bacterium]